MCLLLRRRTDTPHTARPALNRSPLPQRNTCCLCRARSLSNSLKGRIVCVSVSNENDTNKIKNGERERKRNNTSTATTHLARLFRIYGPLSKRQFNPPVSKTYGDRRRRPSRRSCSAGQKREKTPIQGNLARSLARSQLQYPSQRLLPPNREKTILRSSINEIEGTRKMRIFLFFLNRVGSRQAGMHDAFTSSRRRHGRRRRREAMLRCMHGSHRTGQDRTHTEPNPKFKSNPI